ATQLASCLVIMPQRSSHQRACIRIVHVFESASTLINQDRLGRVAVTNLKERRLPTAVGDLPPSQDYGDPRKIALPWKKTVTAVIRVRSSSLKHSGNFGVKTNQEQKTMKRNLLTLTVAGAIALGGFI